LDLYRAIGGIEHTLRSVTLEYGLANRYLYRDKRKDGIRALRRIVVGNQWAGFGFISAEAELARLKP
jgi:hypothetical protein